MSTALLLSGGVDSAALAAHLRPERCFFVDYGQVCANAERRAATAVARHLCIPVESLHIDCSSLGSGDLAGRSMLEHISPSREWWPYRNQLLATFVAARALEVSVTRILFGTVSTDSFHADGTPAFFESLNHLLNLQEGAIQVAAPAIEWTTVELISRSGVGLELLGWTHSCHVSDAPCGYCRGCDKRRQVLQASGLWP